MTSTEIFTIEEDILITKTATMKCEQLDASTIEEYEQIFSIYVWIKHKYTKATKCILLLQL